MGKTFFINFEEEIKFSSLINDIVKWRNLII